MKFDTVCRPTLTLDVHTSKLVVSSRVGSKLFNFVGSDWVGSIDQLCKQHRRTQDFTMEGVHVVSSRARWSGGRSPQKLKQNVKLAYNF